MGNATPTGSSTDVVCPACAKVCNGTRGLASHKRSCPGQAGAAEAGEEQAPESGAVSNTTLAGGATDVVCPTCAKVCKGTRGLASHKRRCPGQAGAAEAGEEQAPEEPESNKRHCPESPAGQDTATGEEAESKRRRRRRTKPEEVPADEPPLGHLPVDPIKVEQAVQISVAEFAKKHPRLLSV